VLTSQRFFRYWVVVAVVVAAGGCSQRRAKSSSVRQNLFQPPTKGVKYWTTATPIGPSQDSISVNINAHNATAETLSFHVSTCGSLDNVVSFGVYRPPHGLLHRGGKRVWSADEWQRLRRPPRSPQPETGGLTSVIVADCHGQTYLVALPPNGDAVIGRRLMAVRDMLGDSIPPGRYHVLASLRSMGGDLKDIKRGTVELRQP
jgi:hypothetical protein